MNGRDREEDRASYLFEQVKPEIMKLLKTAPEYGEVGVSLVLHQGRVIRLTTKSEITWKVTPQTGGAG
jgi:hypothetical protein